ncbi:MAG: putative DNA binding domain-containing protein [Candidatus Desulfofervidaceae bacterium]|nr:putative DNA binding domain-containing protein [Candidatus Desulfofervidaceae bacterium]
MNIEELFEKIEKKEDLHTEFKEYLPSNEELAKEIVAFANTDGGQIIIGVSDDGEIIDVSNPDEVLRRIDDVAYNRCEPPVTVLSETVKVGDKLVIVVHIPKGEQRPYRTSKGFFYIRSANRVRQASREELLRLFQATESIFYDEIEVAKVGFDDIDLEYFEEFMEHSYGFKPEETQTFKYLKNLKIITERKKPTLAGLLFFGINPQTYFPYAKITAAYIAGEDISVPPADKKDFEGKIPEMLENFMRYLRIYLKEKHRIKSLEPEAYPEIPEEVVREAIVNAVAHRNYTVRAPIRVFIFQDRIEFHSPGKLPNTVTIESIKIGGAHVLRNPTIYNLLLKMGLVTDLGSGVMRIIRLVKEHVGKEVELEETETEFILAIPRGDVDETN